MYALQAVKEEHNKVDARNKINDLTNEEFLANTSSIKLTNEDKDSILKLQKYLQAMRILLIKEYGPAVAERLFGQIALGISAFPAEKPNVFDMEHPASFDRREVKSHIELYTKKGDWVLDPMAGSGGTLDVCLQTGRKGIGIELMDHWVNLAITRLSASMNKPFNNGDNNLAIFKSDCRIILPMLKETMDFGIFSPPYYNIMNNPKGWRAQQRKKLGLRTTYGDSDKELGKINGYQNFMKEMGGIYRLCYQTLKNEKYMVVIVADIVGDGHFIPYHMDTITEVCAAGFKLCGIQVVLDHWKKRLDYGIPERFFLNFHHHYALIFQKVEKPVMH